MEEKKLEHISPDLINKNPENPRIIFRESDLNVLLNSIHNVGIQVPLSVFYDSSDRKYYLLDGERRWRCSKKLGLKSVPVIIEPKPTPLQNLLMMFNIHNVRVQWDLLAIAFKINRLIQLEKEQNRRELSKKELSEATGLSTATIARCFDLLELPQKYIDMIWEELKKPQGEQKYTEDLFIEIKKSISAIKRYKNDIAEKYENDFLLDCFFEKYKSGVVKNRVKFRDLSKIARGERVGADDQKTSEILVKFIEDRFYSIESAYEDSVSDNYESRKLENAIDNFEMYMSQLNESVSKLLPEYRVRLIEIRNVIELLLSK